VCAASPQAQSDLEANKAKEAFYQEKLQELIIFKSKTAAALLQAQEWADREKREADQLATQVSLAGFFQEGGGGG
jgi:hypothetical protein